jgi:hypothetical protein
MRTLFLILYRGVLLAPIYGSAIGALLTYLVFSGHSEELTRDPGFGKFCLLQGAAIGGPIGLFFGLLVAWPTRKVPLKLLVPFLAGGTLLFSLPFALIGGEGGPVLAWFGGMVGFWIGAFVLFIHRRVERTERLTNGM